MSGVKNSMAQKQEINQGPNAPSGTKEDAWAHHLLISNTFLLPPSHATAAVQPKSAKGLARSSKKSQPSYPHSHPHPLPKVLVMSHEQVVPQRQQLAQRRRRPQRCARRDQ